jgi:DNA-directed RNA polymerase subunit alpha
MRAGVTTTEELSEKTVEDMMRVRNLRRSSLTEIINAMKTHGLSFKESEEE